MNFPSTSLSLISRLKNPEDSAVWQASWKRFLELYHEPISVVARSCYRSHTGGQEPSSGIIEDAVANVVADYQDCKQLSIYLILKATPSP